MDPVCFASNGAATGDPAGVRVTFGIGNVGFDAGLVTTGSELVLRSAIGNDDSRTTSCICGICAEGRGTGSGGGATESRDARFGGGNAGADALGPIVGDAVPAMPAMPILVTDGSGGIVPPRVGGTVIDRTCAGGRLCCEVPPADRVRGSGATSPAPRIGGIVAVIRGGVTLVVLGLANRSSDGSEIGLSLLLLCTRPIKAFTAVDSLAMASLPNDVREGLRMGLVL